MKTKINELFEGTLIAGLAALFAVALISGPQPADAPAVAHAQVAQNDGANHNG
ncbi:hypothetical protein [Chitinimonas koreensis]|uniref:hypothetical protein n=1 Tax=Chitinimonas koreensis TaxID=356302 RepID=UPI00040DB90B|nr:hypothetical protein [Chitinimonas koreensis]QNM97430.1 hypothetical protein H9L41_03735 [Chitinimonas koreensis]QNM97434.1 hypothetical protein H9L41_03755 [Chitinimonas koreensis]